MKPMTMAQALKRARKLWGASARVADNGKKFRDGTPRPTPEEREALRAILVERMAQKPQRAEIATFGDERTVGELRASWGKYARDYDAWKKETDHLRGVCYARRFDVGTSTFAFFIRGSGDTWEEAFEKATKSNA